MSAIRQARATIDDLYRAPGKAELIGGRIVPLMATGPIPNRAAFRIARSLDDHAERIRKGEAYTDNISYAVSELPSGRESFSPDASYYDGPLPPNPMRFIEGAPTFAAEVRSENDYSDAAEAERGEKRADYFAAGTRVAWDVDPMAECIHVYNASNPSLPTTFRKGQVAEAELAVPGWRVPVDWIFS
jgi:Uma2 family endonuclease